MVLFRHNLPQPTQAQLMRGEFPETLCIEQGVVLSCRFPEWKVRWTSCVLWMAVVSQSSVKSSRRNSASSSVGANPFLNKIIAEVATSILKVLLDLSPTKWYHLHIQLFSVFWWFVLIIRHATVNCILFARKRGLIPYHHDLRCSIKYSYRIL